MYAALWRKVRGTVSTEAARVLAGLALGTVVIALAIWLLPEWLNASTRVDPTGKLTPGESLTAKNATRTALVALLVAIGGIGTLLYTVRSYRLAHTGQVTDRYTKAVEQLGEKGKPQVRVGGVYALEKIVRDSPQDGNAVIDVLVAHVRETRAVSPEPRPESEIPLDTSAALRVLGRLPRVDGMPVLDLRGLDLRKVDLTRANLSGCLLHGTRLDGSVLVGASLRAALLTDAVLAHANLATADLIRADLTNVSLEGADFFGTKILPEQLTEKQKKEVLHWEYADLYTVAGGGLRPIHGGGATKLRRRYLNV